MPDVTPKTESGRALLTRLVEPQSDHERECATCLHTLEEERADEAARILAIEQEAASKAVAEVLDRLEVGVANLPKMDMVIGPWPDAGVEPVVMLPAVRALIASERDP